MILLADQLEQFRNDGVVCLRDVISEAHINGLRAAIEDQMSGCGATTTGYNFEDFAKQIWTEDQTADVGNANRFDMDVIKQRIRANHAIDSMREAGPDTDNAAFFYDTAGWKSYDDIRRAAFDSDLPEITATLLGSEYVNFWEDTTFVKTPGTRQKTAFHQDYAYFQIEGAKCVIVWIPLDPAGPDSGVVRYIRGSHLWQRTFAPNLVIAQTPTAGAVDEVLPDIESNEDAYDIIEFTVQPGDVLIHDVMTVHGAGGNMTEKNRRAISFRYCGDDIRYFDRPGAIPQSGVKHTLKDGERLWSRDYPVVWPRPWPGFSLADAWNVA